LRLACRFEAYSRSNPGECIEREKNYITQRKGLVVCQVSSAESFACNENPKSTTSSYLMIKMDELMKLFHEVKINDDTVETKSLVDGLYR
jgi:hypothetical protein